MYIDLWISIGIAYIYYLLYYIVMIKLQAYLTNFNRKPDRSCKVSFETQELTPDDLLELDKHYQNFGWLVFQENQINLKDIPTEQAEDKNKTPAKRLRAVINVLSRQEGIAPEKFEEYYRAKMEKLIDYIKAKLDK